MQGLVTFGDLELADKKESFFQGLGMHCHSGTPVRAGKTNRSPPDA